MSRRALHLSRRILRLTLGSTVHSPQSPVFWPKTVDRGLWTTGNPRQFRWIAGLGRALAACVTIGIMAGLSCGRSASRDVVMVARGMEFRLEARPESPNPVIRLHPGERVRLVLKNEAPGLVHDMVIPAWAVQTDQIRSGETTAVTFTVPSAPGSAEYRCRPHAELMKGVVEVAP